jgi:eukaryotic-like serine/threonine-protein kinase
LARTPLRDTDPSWVGAYRLQARLGAGGMGVVYLAAAQDGRLVALKVLRPEMAGDAEFRKRFSREVTALHRVQGVCTVRVIDADTTAAQPYLVTEYAEGPSLAEYVESRGPMDPQMLYGLATGLAEALTAIHAAGIVHRDLKPSNVLLTPGGPKVIDFGIAQVLEATAVTRAGMTVGSAGYMAPEQIMGRAGTAADLFSWAVTIAYAASGQPPFGTGTSEVILYRILHEAPDIAAVPDSLRPQVTAALSKDPHDRPAAAELLSQLTRTAVVPAAGAGADNPTQTILAQTWRPPTAPRETSAPPTPPPAAPSWAAPPQGTPSQPRSFWATTPAPDTPSRGASSRTAPPGPTPPSGWPAQPDDYDARAPRRPGLRRPVLVALVVGVAIVLGAGGAALAFALGGHSSTSNGNHAGAGGSHSATAPATSAVTSSSAAASSPAVSTSASASTSPSPTTSATPSSSATLPVLVVGSYSGMKPAEIGYSGDSTNVVTGITWGSWTATSATGTGTSDIDSCVPSCAAASPNPVTTTVTLSNPVDGHFTQMSETRNGTTTNYTYPGSWAQSAS